MLGRLRMSIEDCEREYKCLLQQLHATTFGNWFPRQVFGGTKKDSKLYEAAVKEMIQYGLDKDPVLGYGLGPDDCTLTCSARQGTSELAEDCMFQEGTQKCKV
jgi:hypothetical protein